MSEKVELNDEQLKAFKSFERAFKKCLKANIQFYTVLESVHLLNGDELNVVGDDGGDPEVSTVADLSCYIMDMGLSGWADDRHSVTRKT